MEAKRRSAAGSSLDEVPHPRIVGEVSDEALIQMTPAHDQSAQPASPGVMRTETDSLGSMEIPADAYWGIHTARALDNFPISRRPISVYPHFVHAFGAVKQAAARANVELGVLAPDKGALIEAACEEVKQGLLDEHFIVGVVQGGAGTSTNMNANEVIANRALELAGRRKGDYAHLHPIDDVNRSQSTNDVYPTALKIALCMGLDQLLQELDELRIAFAHKGKEFAHILKVGRTQLQDAVPMTLGQEFRGFAVTLGEDHARLRETIPLLFEHNLGATAIGTGITADSRYAESVNRHLRVVTGYDTDDRDRPRRGDLGRRRLHVPVRSPQALRDQAVEDLQRPPPALLGSAGGLRRDQPAAAPGGLVDHAGQGESGHPRGREPGRVLGRRRRRHGHDGGRGGTAPAQRLRADHRPLAAAEPRLDGRRAAGPCA